MPLPSDRLQIIHQVSPVDYGQMPSTFSRPPPDADAHERTPAGWQGAPDSFRAQYGSLRQFCDQRGYELLTVT
ncbi:MAG: hypothetical protein QOD88_1666 [Mycobacterium sp.]|jgi:hypothetical protein|nr:hypothetical protein [Mycobacterium sp.]